MKEVSGGTIVKINKEYEKLIRGRMKRALAASIIGILMSAIILVCKFCTKVSMNNRILGVYLGLGIGLITAGIGLWIKDRLLFDNEKKFKENSLNEMDERNQEIENKAFRSATYAMMAALTVAAVTVGIFDPVLVGALTFAICIFLIAYTIASRYYNKRI